MTKIPSRTVMKLDPNDSNLLLGIPYDPEPEDNSSQQMSLLQKSGGPGYC
eukprot:m.222503 g.222503  ORF g.222503 m.222503 type:complete len:50 (+) comp39977_c0_seq19:1384-1533(+)